MIKWENLPERIKNEKTYPYYELLQQKKIQILWKRVLDFFCAVVLTVLLSPVMLLIAAAIKLDTKGPIFYRQTRVTRYGMTYRIFKFRTMITGADKKGPLVTSSQDDRVTKVGKLLRKIRLDELPQLFNILAVQMSVVGPRPALWNQADLIAERDKYGANALVPGLTGYAQVNGRDELPIPVKAELDGYYAAHVSFVLDMKIFFKTIFNVLAGRGVVEGGTQGK